MKKMFLYAAMASIAFASCTTDEKIFDGTDESNEIRFVAAQYSVQSRAEHDPGAAFTDDVTIWSWYDGNDTKVIDGDVYNQTAFKNGKKYYWPVGNSGEIALDFVSVPTGMVTKYLENQKPTRDDEGNTTLTFNVDKSKDYHADNLMTTQVLSGSKSDGNIALLFRHLFAKVKVNVAQVARTESFKNARWTVTLKDLKFIGLHDKGSVTINNSWTAANSGNDCAWTSTGIDADNANAGSRVWSIFTGTKDLYNAPTDVDNPNDEGSENSYSYTSDYYMLPQVLQAGIQKVVISYDVTTDYLGNPTQPNTVISYEKEIDLSTAGVAQWYMNKVITYTININPSTTISQITFTVNEEEWGGGSGSGSI